MTINPSVNPFISRKDQTTNAILPPCPSSTRFPYLWQLSASVNFHSFPQSPEQALSQAMVVSNIILLKAKSYMKRWQARRDLRESVN